MTTINGIRTVVVVDAAGTPMVNGIESIIPVNSAGVATGPAYYTPEMTIAGLPGALGGGANDTAAFGRALDAAVTAGRKLQLTQDLAITQWTNTSVLPLWIDFNGYKLTVTPPDANGGLVILSTSSVLTLGTGGIARGAVALPLTSTTGVAEGDLIYLQSNIIAESARGVTRKQLFRVETVDSATQVTVAPPANFAFAVADAGLFVRQYATPRQVTLERPKFVNLTPNSTVYRSCFIGGAGKTRITDLDIDTPSVTAVSLTGACSDGIFIALCDDVIVDRSRLRGQRYGIKPDSSNNVTIRNTRSDCNRHAVSPSGWSDGVRVHNLHGENNIAIMDSHEAFNVYFDSVDTTSDVEVSNNRSCGGSVTNSRFRSVHASQATQMQNIVFVTSDGTTPDLQYYADHDFYVDNVEWYAPAGFTVDRGRNVTVNNLRMTSSALLTLGVSAAAIARVAVGRDVNYSSSSVFNGTTNVLPNHFGTGVPVLNTQALTVRYNSANDRPVIYGGTGTTETGLDLTSEVNTQPVLVRFRTNNSHSFLIQLQTTGDTYFQQDGTNFLHKLATTGDLALQGTFGFRLGGDTGPRIVAGAGTPEASITAPIGSIYMRTDGGASTSHYIKESGTGNTGWVAK